MTLPLEDATEADVGAGRNVGLINAGLWLMPDDVSAAAGQTHGERLRHWETARHG